MLYLVLILVLMEDTLGVNILPKATYVSVVLILVLMEDTLGVTTIREHLSKGVLILVLMEDTLGAIQI